MLHVAADGGERRRRFQLAPVDAVEAESVVGVPENHGAVPQPAVEECLRDQAHGVGGVPLLAQDHHQLAGPRRWLDQVVDQVRGQAAVPVDDLDVLAVVDAAPVRARQPLAPAMQPQAAIEGLLLGRQVRIAQEEEMGLVARRRQRAAKLLGPHP